MHIRNAPTKLMKELGYADGYRYDHNESDGYAAGETYLPDELVGTRYYDPPARGLEAKIRDKLSRLRQRDAAHETRRQTSQPAASNAASERNG